jgi:hypothetical protein
MQQGVTRWNDAIQCRRMPGMGTTSDGGEAVAKDLDARRESNGIFCQDIARMHMCFSSEGMQVGVGSYVIGSGIAPASLIR